MFVGICVCVVCAVCVLCVCFFRFSSFLLDADMFSLYPFVYVYVCIGIHVCIDEFI